MRYNFTSKPHLTAILVTSKTHTQTKIPTFKRKNKKTHKISWANHLNALFEYRNVTSGQWNHSRIPIASPSLRISNKLVPSKKREQQTAGNWRHTWENWERSFPHATFTCGFSCRFFALLSAEGTDFDFSASAFESPIWVRKARYRWKYWMAENV